MAHCCSSFVQGQRSPPPFCLQAGVGGEQFMEVTGIKLRELLVWQLITGYKLRELEAKEMLEKQMS